jgi:hypothetical protein
VDSNARWLKINNGWALTTDGQLFNEGTTNISSPFGLSPWLNLGDNGWAFSADGQIYSGGTNLVNFAITNIFWSDGGSGDQSTVTLAKDGVAYEQGTDVNAHPTSTPFSFPTGVAHWTNIGIALDFAILQGDDGNLYNASPGVSTPSLIPLPAGVTNWTALAVGGFHVLAIGSDGQLYTWGRNFEGELGLGTEGADQPPTQKVSLPPGVTAWMGIAAGYTHSLAIGNDGSLYAWGANDNGQLGIGPLPGTSIPTQVNGVGALWTIPVIASRGTNLRQPDGSFLVKFKTDLNRTYQIQYTDDMHHWKIASPNILGTGGFVEWLDNGPPKTDVSPASVPTRAYRLSFTH